MYLSNKLESRSRSSLMAATWGFRKSGHNECIKSYVKGEDRENMREKTDKKRRKVG